MSPDEQHLRHKHHIRVLTPEFRHLPLHDINRAIDILVGIHAGHLIISARVADINADDDIRAFFTQNAARNAIDHAAVNIRSSIDLHGHKDAGNGHACAHRPTDLPVVQGDGFAARSVHSDAVERDARVGKIQTVRKDRDQFFKPVSAQQPPGTGFPDIEIFAHVHLCSKLFKQVQIGSRRIDGADDRTDARTGDYVDWNMVLFQHL